MNASNLDFLELGPVIGMDPPCEADDYMVGQISTRRVVDADGHQVVGEGETVTPAIIAQARRLGLLHALDTRFAD